MKCIKCKKEYKLIDSHHEINDGRYRRACNEIKCGCKNSYCYDDYLKIILMNEDNLKSIGRDKYGTWAEYYTPEIIEKINATL